MVSRFHVNLCHQGLWSIRVAFERAISKDFHWCALSYWSLARSEV